MNHDHYPQALLYDVLSSVNSIAIVGASPNNSRPSYGVTAFLISKGFTAYAVNPGHSGALIAGAMTYAALSELPQAVDMVDVFRASQHLPDVIESVLNLAVLPKVIWTQLGVRDDQAAQRAEKAGIIVIQNRCPVIEMPRLGL